MHQRTTVKIKYRKPIIRMRLRTYLCIRDTILCLYHHRWLFVAIAWCAVIYAFSHQQGPQSAAASSGLQKHMTLLAWLFKIIPIRSLAHMALYAILAVPLYLHFRKQQFGKTITLAICYGYALLDEMHQLFVPGRSAQLTDTLLDLSGAILGLTIITITLWVTKALHKRAERLI